LSLNSKNPWVLRSASGLLLFLSYSTGSLQAPAIFFVGMAIYLLSRAHRELKKSTFSIFLLTFFLGSGLLFLSFLGIGPLGAILFQYTLKLRIFEYWRVAVEIVSSRPLTGMGPDSYVEGFRIYKGLDFIREYSQQVQADSAHNVLLNFMANYGIPAFLLLLVLVIWISAKSLATIFSKGEIDDTSQATSYLWILLLTQSLFSLEQIGLTVPLWACGGILLNSKIRKSNKVIGGKELKEDVTENRGLKAFRGEIAVVTAMLSMLVLWSPLNQEIQLQRLKSTALQGSSSAEDVTSVLSRFTDFTKAETMRAINLADFLIRSEKYAEAELLMNYTVGKDPDAYEAFEQLARLSRFAGNLDKEYEMRLKIMKINPLQFKNLYDLAEVSSALGKKTEARNYLNEILTLSFDVGLSESATQLLSTLD